MRKGLIMQNALDKDSGRFGARVLRRLSLFQRDEEGSMVIFAMFIFITMLVVAGIAVDLMRFETNRSRLQATLDRAVLASSDLEQTLDPEAVVRDYFAKADLLDQLDSIVVTEGFNSRSVRATASLDVNMMFMPLLGIDQMTAPAGGTAIENVSDIEIMLVLDVSGSMASNSKLVNLQSAARDFVTTVLTPDIEQRISIGIIPFNGQVNLGPILRARYNVIDLHGVANANCVDLPAAAYATSDLSTTLAMPQTAHVDSFTTTNNTNNMTSSGTLASANPPVETNRWCPPSAGNIVRLPTRNITTLNNHINGLTAVGATSINAGMRWGLELLDPGSRPMYDTLIGAGQIPSNFSGRPYDYRRQNTLKVIVLMTDGEHFAEERVNAGFRSGNSPIWRATDSNAYFSIYHESLVNRSNATNLALSRPFWVPHLGVWLARPWGGTVPPTSMPFAEGTNRRFDVNGDGTCNNTDDGRGSLTAAQACWSRATQRTWPQVWADVRMSFVAWQLYARALGSTTTARNTLYTDQMNAFRTYTPVTSMNSQLQGLCGMARDSAVVVYGIAFEAPAGGQAQIYGCSSSPSHYYDAVGRDAITAAFRSIANQINSLRLIQ